MEMVNYVVRRIEQQADISLEAGQAKYRAYFVKIHIYERYRAEVEVRLIADGYGDCIVTE